MKDSSILICLMLYFNTGTISGKRINVTWTLQNKEGSFVVSDDLWAQGKSNLAVVLKKVNSKV